MTIKYVVAGADGSLIPVSSPYDAQPSGCTIDDTISRLNSTHIGELLGVRSPPVQHTSAQPGPGRKDDSGKSRLDLIPPHLFRAIAGSFADRGYPALALNEIGKVLAFGAGKYGENNWQKVERGTDRYYAAALRHLGADLSGESVDPESGLLHLAHAATSILFKCWLDGVADWYRPQPVRETTALTLATLEHLTYGHEAGIQEDLLDALLGCCELLERAHQLVGVLGKAA